MPRGVFFFGANARWRGEGRGVAGRSCGQVCRASSGATDVYFTDFAPRDGVSGGRELHSTVKYLCSLCSRGSPVFPIYFPTEAHPTAPDYPDYTDFLQKKILNFFFFLLAIHLVGTPPFNITHRL